MKIPCLHYLIVFHFSELLNILNFNRLKSVSRSIQSIYPRTHFKFYKPLLCIANEKGKKIKQMNKNSNLKKKRIKGGNRKIYIRDKKIKKKTKKRGKRQDMN